jgi:hypothetical protein
VVAMAAKLNAALATPTYTGIVPHPVIANQVLGKDRLAEWAFRLLDISPGPARAKQNLYAELVLPPTSRSCMDGKPAMNV